MVMDKLTKKVVKKKHLQKAGDNLAVLIPKAWIDENEWNQTTNLILEFLPYRKMIIISDEKNSNTVSV